MTLSKIIWIAMIIWLLEIVLVSMFFRTEWVNSNIAEEQHDYANHFESEALSKINEKANKFYRKYFVDSGFRDTTFHVVIPTEAEKTNTHYMENIGAPVFDKVYQGLETLWTVILRVVVRIFAWVHWSTFTLIILIPAVIDGVAMRKVKKATFQNSSSVIQRYSAIFILLAFYVLLLSLFSPIAVHPYIYPAVTIVAAAMIGIIVANVQKQI